MDKIAAMAGGVFVFSVLALAPANGDHPGDRSGAGATTPAGPSIVAQAGSSAAPSMPGTTSGNTGSATGTSSSTSGGGNTGALGGRSDSAGPSQGPATGESRQIQQGRESGDSPAQTAPAKK